MRFHLPKAPFLSWALALAGGAVLAMASASVAQVSCEVPTRRYSPQCGDDYPKQPCKPQSQPLQSPQYAPPGAFVAPPQSGVVQGASEGYGVRGMEIEFPAMRFRMPSVTFPSWYSTRDNAKMVLDSANAPYVPGNFAAFPVAPAYGGVPSQAPSRAPIEPQQTPQQTPQNYPPDQPPYYGPQKAPGCNAQYNHLPSAERLAIEERLKSLEHAEQRLQLKLQEMQQVYQQMAALEAQRAARPAQPFEQLQTVRYAEEVRERPRRVPVMAPTAADYEQPSEMRHAAPQGVRRLPTSDE